MRYFRGGNFVLTALSEGRPVAPTLPAPGGEPPGHCPCGAPAAGPSSAAPPCPCEPAPLRWARGSGAPVLPRTLCSVAPSTPTRLVRLCPNRARHPPPPDGERRGGVPAYYSPSLRRDFKPGMWRGRVWGAWTGGGRSPGVCALDGSRARQQHSRGGCASSGMPPPCTPAGGRAVLLHFCLAAGIVRFPSARLRQGNLRCIT